MTTTAAPELKRPARALVSLVVGLVACVPALLLAAPALVGIEADAMLNTALTTGVTAAFVLLATAAGGMRWGAESNVLLAMSCGLGALLVVGFPLFVVLEPVWWRFALGMVGPLVVAAGVAYGAPRAGATFPKVRTAVGQWLLDPLRLLQRMFLSLIGRDAEAARTAASRR